MIPLPHENTDVLKLADWLELCALVAPDGDASCDDLDSALRTLAVFPTVEEDDKITELTMAVFHELESRKAAALEGYPFEITLPTIRLNGDWQNSPTYVFCLCLSYFGDPDNPSRKTYPRRCFEHLARDAAISYLGGGAVRFASPRHRAEIPSNFGKAINKLCVSFLIEGGGFKEGGGLPNQQDSKVDIVAWKHFPDNAVGKLVLFGNCATGKNWHSAKLSELNPRVFCEEWMLDCPSSPVVRSLFIPHRCAAKPFVHYSRTAGIVFDRCRISYWCHIYHTTRTQDRGPIFTDMAGILQWTTGRLHSLQS